MNKTAGICILSIDKPLPDYYNDNQLIIIIFIVISIIKPNRAANCQLTESIIGK